MRLCLPHDQERFTEEERNIIAACKTPQETQDFINNHIAYNWEEDGIARLRSFRRVVRDQVAHCFEGALTAAAILFHHGYPPLLACMEAEDIDHLLFMYQKEGKWGSVAQSRDRNLKGRPPIYGSTRELILSYREHYKANICSNRPVLTLRGYRTFDLRNVPMDWMTTEEDVWPAEDLTFEGRYTALFPKNGFREFKSNRDGTITWLPPDRKHDVLWAPRNGTEPRDRADD